MGWKGGKGSAKEIPEALTRSTSCDHLGSRQFKVLGEAWDVSEEGEREALTSVPVRVSPNVRYSVFVSWEQI